MKKGNGTVRRSIYLPTDSDEVDQAGSIPRILYAALESKAFGASEPWPKGVKSLSSKEYVAFWQRSHQVSLRLRVNTKHQRHAPCR